MSRFRRYISEYRSVNAKVFKKGDEDGMSCIRLLVKDGCIWKDEAGAYEQCSKCPPSIEKRPYINKSKDEMFFGTFGKFYLCTDDTDDRWLVEKENFEKKYTGR